MNTMRLVFSLLVAGITASSVQADVYGPYIKDADLTDDHVTTGECGWSMHQTPWNKGHGTFPYQGNNWCRGTTRKGRGQTIEGEAAGRVFYIMVEDALGFDEYEIEGGVYAPYLAVAAIADDSGSSYTQADIDDAVEAALADVIDDLVTSEELVEFQDRLEALE
jgi:hypothetical protein